jgi:hypothetical protein
VGRRKADARLSRASLDDVITSYLAEATRPAKARAAAASSRTPEVLASIERFAGAFQQAGLKQRRKVGGTGGPSAMRVGAQDPLQHLLDTVADFVTPGDLFKCDSLLSVGTIPL